MTIAMVRLIVKPLSLFLLLMVNDVMGKDTGVYYLHLETRHAIVTVLLNGAPVVKLREQDSVSTDEPINLWLLDSHNTLSLRIEKTAGDNEDYAPSVSASIFLHDSESHAPNPKVILASLDFVGDKETTYPTIGSVEIDKVFPIWTTLWDKATPITSLTDADRKAIVSLVNAFVDSLKRHDIEEVIKLQRYKIEDDAIAEGKSVAQIEKALEINYRWLSEQKALESHPLSLDDAVFNECYDNKLIYVERSNGDEAVMFESDELYFDVPTYVAKIDGKWSIVR
jgi:hypothetical protein